MLKCSKQCQQTENNPRSTLETQKETVSSVSMEKHKLIKHQNIVEEPFDRKNSPRSTLSLVDLCKNFSKVRDSNNTSCFQRPSLRQDTCANF